LQRAARLAHRGALQDLVRQAVALNAVGSKTSVRASKKTKAQPAPKAAGPGLKKHAPKKHAPKKQASKKQ
jgi:hypothetical protein